jgi:hypothetical protein
MAPAKEAGVVDRCVGIARVADTSAGRIPEFPGMVSVVLAWDYSGESAA